MKLKTLFELGRISNLPTVWSNVLAGIVIAGGTSLVLGFVERLRELTADGFPVPISEIKHAEDPLFAVSNGLYEAARLSLQ